MRVLENHPSDSTHVNLRVTALKQLMVGKVRYQFEMWEESMKAQGSEHSQWKRILNNFQDYATRRRLDANMQGKGNSMDVDGMDWNEWERWDSWGSWDGDEGSGGEQGDLDALGKGKYGGKGGKKDGGKGKGGYKGGCYNCGQPGHSAKFCTYLPKGKGKGKGLASRDCYPCGY